MKNEILIVDDSKVNRDLLSYILEDDYAILKASNGLEAIEIIERKKTHLKLILLDLLMPEMDGFEVLRQMKKSEFTGKIPVIVISSESDDEVQVKAFEYGVSDYITKPFGKEVVKQRVQNVIDLFDYRNSLEEKIQYQTNQLKTQYDILMQQAIQLRDSNLRITDVLGSVVESRNMEGSLHIKRVKEFTEIIGMQFMKDNPEYSLTKEKVKLIALASSLHDIGKISIPDSILFKPDKLTEDEFDYIKSHPARGCEILEEIDKIWDKEYAKICYEICRYHHERYDGKGYPEGLKGDEIPVSAQLVSIADAYEVLTSERIYKAAYSSEEAFSMIMRGECGVFSPKLLESFRKCKKSLGV